MKHFLLIITILLLTSCSHFMNKNNQAEFPRFHKKEIEKVNLSHLKKLSLFDRFSWPETKLELPEKSNEELYSFIAKDMSIQDALKLFAQSYNLNILLDQDIQGDINVEFKQLPFNQAMKALLDSLGFYWQTDKNLIRVRSWETRLFNVNYIRLTRAGSSESGATVSSGSSGGEGSSSDSEAGKITIKQENKIEFWDQLEQQLKLLVSEEGRLSINKIAGTIQVSDRHPRVKELAQYINDVKSAIHRQVNIEVKILEVTLNDDFSLGVDWTKVANANGTGTQTNFSLSNIIGTPVGTGVALPPSFIFNATDGDRKYTSLINALEEQGEVQIVSQPHIRIMNNQSALFKAGTDRTFFRQETSEDANTTATNAQTVTTDVPQVVTEGIVLSITPQISKDGWIMMDISPVVTRVSSVSEVIKDGDVRSSAPNLDIRQTSSLIRAFNGETIVIGGLIQTQESKSKRGVPGLNKVPGLGKLFSGQYDNLIRKELIIFLTPTLIDTNIPSDMASKFTKSN